MYIVKDCVRKKNKYIAYLWHAKISMYNATLSRMCLALKKANKANEEEEEKKMQFKYLI